MKMNERLAELIGAIIGDGCIRYKPEMGQYYIEIVGNMNEENDYFHYLSKIFIEELNLKTSIKIRGRGLRLRVYSKNFIKFLVNELKLPFNKNKCQNIIIPSLILNDEFLLGHCLKGIMDTDGSLFLANKGYRKDYPTIEISTISPKLAQQLRDVLSIKFRIGFRSYKQDKFQRIYRISLNGEKMVNKWYEEIGFSNQRNLGKYYKYKKEWERGDLNPQHPDLQFHQKC